MVLRLGSRYLPGVYELLHIRLVARDLGNGPVMDVINPAVAHPAVIDKSVFDYNHNAGRAHSIKFRILADSVQDALIGRHTGHRYGLSRGLEPVVCKNIGYNVARKPTGKVSGSLASHTVADGNDPPVRRVKRDHAVLIVFAGPPDISAVGYNKRLVHHLYVMGCRARGLRIRHPCGLGEIGNGDKNEYGVPGADYVIILEGAVVEKVLVDKSAVAGLFVPELELIVHIAIEN